MNPLEQKQKLENELKGSFLAFIRFFFPILTGRDFIVSHPVGRESHHITISKALTKALRLQIPSHRLLINTAPGTGKSAMMTFWVAWAMSQYPDSKFIYVSYSKVLADKMTEQIKRIMQLPEYEYLFGFKIRRDSKAKDYFQTEFGGAVASAGSAGTITGLSAGEPGLDRFSGALLLDDLIKPDEAHSQTIRESVIHNYSETLQQRVRGLNVPIIMISQRLHEADLCQFLIDGKDGYNWETVIIKSIDECGNVIYPEVFSREALLKRKETDPYVFSSQYQQEPIPAGGALFKPEWFVLLDEEPEMICTFIVADTAETSRTYNDATAMGFFGVYEIIEMGRKTGVYGLHWIDAIEVHVEPRELKDTFMDFWHACMRYPVQPKFAAIEKKSTGVTLVSTLQEIRTMRILDIQRSAASGSKTKRFLDAQPLIAERKVSLYRYGKHTHMCLQHMSKITANDGHRRDDLCDTLVDALRLVFTEKVILSNAIEQTDYTQISRSLMQDSRKISQLRANAYRS